MPHVAFVSAAESLCDGDSNQQEGTISEEDEDEKATEKKTF